MVVIVWTARRARNRIAMPVYRDARTQRWYFRAHVRKPDGSRLRVFGTPGAPGPYQDIANTKVGAKEAEDRAKARALLEIKPPAVRTERRTIREHAATFLENYKPDQKPSERRSKSQILDGHLLPYFGDKYPDQIEQVDVDTFARLELARPCAIKTVNNRLAVLSSLIRYATGARPTLRLCLDGLPGEITAVPAADVERLLEHATEREALIILLASDAGLRSGEIRGLQHTDVRDVITVRRALDNATNEEIAPKHNKSRSIPPSPRLATALAAAPRRGPWVVSTATGDALGYYTMRDTLVALYARAGVPRPSKPLHCLRHAFGTEMAKQVPLGVLQDLMGHEDVKTTMRYVDVDAGQKRDAIARVFGARVSHAPASPQPRT